MAERAHHPYWKDEFLRPSRKAWVGPFLLGVAYHLRLVQATRAGDGWHALSPTGRWLLGLGEAPAAREARTQALLVQRTSGYRQGLSRPPWSPG